MKRDFRVRQIAEADYPIVYTLIEKAFQTAEHRDGDEQDFAVRLRQGENYIPQLDLIAQQADGQIVGHIMFTRTYVTRDDGSRYDTLLVAPLSVLFEWRSVGVGSALMQEGLRIARLMGYESAFLVGDPNYYQRFGYRLSHLYGIGHESLPPEYVMVRELVDGALDGVTGVVNM